MFFPPPFFSSAHLYTEWPSKGEVQSVSRWSAAEADVWIAEDLDHCDEPR